MQLALSKPSMPPLLPVWCDLSENSRQVLEAKNPAWHTGSTVVNSTAVIGFRASLFLNAIRQIHSARYYNPNTGRFMGRDPEDDILADPKRLHKYIYANGDPVNLSDPTGRAAAAPTMPGTAGGDIGEYGRLILSIGIRSIPAVAAVGCAINIRNSMSALGVLGWEDVYPAGFCSARAKPVRCRFKVYIHPIGMPNHAGLGPFVAIAQGRGCSDACAAAQTAAYAAAAAAAPAGYHIQHEGSKCPY